MVNRFKVVMTKVAIFIWLSLAILVGGCGVDHPDQAAYSSVKESCLKKDMVMEVFVNPTMVRIQCVKPQ